MVRFSELSWIHVARFWTVWRSDSDVFWIRDSVGASLVFAVPLGRRYDSRRTNKWRATLCANMGETLA